MCWIRYLDLLRPDRVAVVFDGKQSWQSRRNIIEQARAIAKDRAEKLFKAANAAQAEAEALSQAVAAAAAGDYSQSRASVKLAREQAFRAAKQLDAVNPTEHAAFVEEIFGVVETSFGSGRDGKYIAAVEEAYSGLDMHLEEARLSETVIQRLQEQEAECRRNCQTVRDAAESAQRLTDFPSYKGNRPPTPEVIATVLGEAPSLVRSLGWPTFVVDGIEADDVIGQILFRCCNPASGDTLVANGDSSSAPAALASTDAGCVVPYILSKDKDFTQLLDLCPDLLLLRPRHSAGMRAEHLQDDYYGLEKVDLEAVAEKYAVLGCCNTPSIEELFEAYLFVTCTNPVGLHLAVPCCMNCNAL